MKKIASALLAGCMLVTSAVCTGVVASAEEVNNKATIAVYDYCNVKFDPKQDVHPETKNKAMKRAVYEFEVGDIVNISVSYKSPVAISAVTGGTYINQIYRLSNSNSAFREFTDGECDIMALTDSYYRSQKDSKGNALYDKYTYFNCNLNNVLAGANPSDCYVKNAETVYSRDKIGYMFASASLDGFATKKTNVFTFTVKIEKPGQAYVYTETEEAVASSDLSDVTTGITSVTSMTKVGHEDTALPVNDGKKEVRVYFDSKVYYTNYRRDAGVYISLLAKNIDGKYFSHWSTKPDGSDVLSTYESYKFVVSKSTAIYAIYKDNPEDVLPDDRPAMNISNVYATTDGVNNSICYQYTRNIDLTKYKIKEQGMLFGRDKATFLEDAESKLVRGGAKVSKMTDDDVSANKSFIFTYNMGEGVDNILWARGFITLMDLSTKEVVTYYTDVTMYTYKSLLHNLD